MNMNIARCKEKCQRLNKLIQTSRKTEKTKNSQSFRVMNVNPTIKTTQKFFQRTTRKAARGAKDRIFGQNLMDN